MNVEKVRGYGAMTGVFAMIAASGGNWLITPHPDASGAHQIAVIAQVVVSIILAIWFWRRAGKVPAPSSTSETDWIPSP